MHPTEKNKTSKFSLARPKPMSLLIQYLKSKGLEIHLQNHKKKKKTASIAPSGLKIDPSTIGLFVHTLNICNSPCIYIHRSIQAFIFVY